MITPAEREQLERVYREDTDYVTGLLVLVLIRYQNKVATNQQMLKAGFLSHQEIGDLLIDATKDYTSLSEE